MAKDNRWLCNIEMICLKLNWFLRSKSYVAILWIVWPVKYSVYAVFNNFLLIDATDRSKISSYQKRFFIALSLYPLSFFANTPFKYSLLMAIIKWFSKEGNRFTVARNHECKEIQLHKFCKIVSEVLSVVGNPVDR